MVATARRAEPVETRVVREGPDGRIIEEVLLVVPGRPDSKPSNQTILDLPYTLITHSTEELGNTLPTVASEDASVALGRLDGKFCYILEGKDARLWISKGELWPLKIEVLSEKRLGTDYLYLDMVNLSEKVNYPSRTEVWRHGELVLVERLLPAAAATDAP
jgi:hypothetical protein